MKISFILGLLSLLILSCTLAQDMAEKQWQDYKVSHRVEKERIKKSYIHKYLKLLSKLTQCFFFISSSTTKATTKLRMVNGLRYLKRLYK